MKPSYLNFLKARFARVVMSGPHIHKPTKRDWIFFLSGAQADLEWSKESVERGERARTGNRTRNRKKLSEKPR